MVNETATTPSSDAAAKGLLPLIHVRDGMSQSARALPALQENYFNVSELRFEQLLSLATEYARVVTYYELDNRAEGTWDSIFMADELVLIATLLSFDLGTLEAKYEQQRGAQVDNQVATGQVELLSIAQQLDFWMVRLSHAQSSAGRELCGLIESVVRGLRQELRGMMQIWPGADLHAVFSPSFVQLAGLEPAADSPAAEADALSLNVADPGALDSPAMREATLRSVFSSLMQAIDIVQSGARKLLPASMQSESHDPGTALLVAFVKLYQKLQTKINAFTQNHLDFYYEQVLRAQPRPMEADTAHLVMQVTTAKSEVLIPAGTEFLARIEGDKRDMVYAADQTVVLNDVAVTHLHTLFFPRDPGAFARTGSDELAKACWQDDVAVVPDAAARARDGALAKPLMGAPRNGRRPATVRQARLGFALADSVLLMHEGQRKIMVTLHYDQSRSVGRDSLEAQIKRFTAHSDNTSADHMAAAQKDTFFRLFKDMFAISLTGSAGWIAIDHYLPACRLVDVEIPENCLVIAFNLPEDCGAIAAYSSAIHGEEIDTALPLIRFTLNANEYQFPYDILKNLALSEARIDISVQGCRDLLLHNQIGQLSPLAPFAPFGPLPAVGSYFVVGYAEVRFKQLSSLDVDIEWGGLPPTGMDFSRWYRGYDSPPTTRDFVASVSALVNGKWQVSDQHAAAPIQLFNQHEVLGQPGIVVNKRLSCAQVISLTKSIDSYRANGTFDYTPASKNGFFKFTLSGPANAFGHQAYPYLLSKVLTQNARMKAASLQLDIPTPPYTPQIAAISLNYSAYSVIPMDNGAAAVPQSHQHKLIHLHPFGWESQSHPSDNRVLQLPRYDARATLFIGLTGSAIGQDLSLYFHLQRDSLPMPVDQSPGIEWAYLSDNQWRTLAPGQVVADTTQGFMTSGIVSLVLPGDGTRNNTVMPAGQYWLRVSAHNFPENFCTLYAVYAQAIQVSWQRGEDVTLRKQAWLPAGSITRARQSIKGLGKITQVSASFNGKPTEDASRMRVRVSERLRHKNRALTASDYESLVLERFPQIYKVKCFANTRSDMPGQTCPGHVLVVPVPYLALDGHLHQKPRLSGHLIHDVRDFLQKLAPPFATIRVENPVYEDIQVRCTVKLADGLRGGIYVTQLNQAICDYLSPWNPLGYTTHFGWRVRQYDMESFIQSLSYIDYVTDFSMLRLASEGDHLFSLNDTARPKVAQLRALDLTPKHPWSIAVPISEHYVATTNQSTDIGPTVTGIEKLEVGRTFIILEKQ